MSAYSGRPVPILAVPSPSRFESGGVNVSHGTLSLPQIASELEAYFSAAKQLESAFHQERLSNQELRSVLAEQSAKSSHAIQELQTQLKQLRAREDNLRDQLELSQAKEKHQHHLVSELQMKLSHQGLDADKTIHDSKMREALLRSQHEASVERERTLRTRLQEFSQRGRKLEMDLKLVRSQHAEDRHQWALNQELARATVENCKTREEKLKAALATLEIAETASKSMVESLRAQLQKASQEVQRYQTAWNSITHVERRSKDIIEDYEKTRAQLEETRDILARERHRLEEVEAVAKKEKRDKQIALNCLNTAEVRIEELNHELTSLKIYAGMPDVVPEEDPHSVRLGF